MTKPTDRDEVDHVIRRALAVYRLCWLGVPDGWEILDEKLKEVVGEDWQSEYEERTGEPIRLE